MLDDSKVQRKATETLMNSSREQFSNTQQQNRQKLDDILLEVTSLESKIPELNKQICDGETSIEQPCDELCGGAGCDGKCGGKGDDHGEGRLWGLVQ